jgi:hypothetical protein
MCSRQHARVSNRHTFITITVHYQQWSWRKALCGINWAEAA